MDFAIPLLLFSPVHLAIITVPPIEIPNIIPVIVCITWLPIATAETDAESENCPTTNKSAAP